MTVKYLLYVKKKHIHVFLLATGNFLALSTYLADCMISIHVVGFLGEF